jgi:hypothetical protein
MESHWVVYCFGSLFVVDCETLGSTMVINNGEGGGELMGLISRH